MIFACLNKNDFPSLIVACSERNAFPCLGRAPQSPSHFSTPLLQRSSQIMASMMWSRLVMARLVLNMCMLRLHQLVCMFAPQGVCDSIHLFLHQLRCRWPLCLCLKECKRCMWRNGSHSQLRSRATSIHKLSKRSSRSIPTKFPPKLASNSHHNSHLNSHQTVQERMQFMVVNKSHIINFIQPFPPSIIGHGHISHQILSAIPVKKSCRWWRHFPSAFLVFDWPQWSAAGKFLGPEVYSGGWPLGHFGPT